MRRLALIAVALAFAAPLSAQTANIMAEYWADSGSLPPEYAWQTNVTITAEGKLTLRYCIGYETEGDACKTRTAEVSKSNLAAILAAVAAGDLVAKPPRQSEDIPIGGDASGGKVFVDGQAVTLSAFPIADDAARVATVLDTIRAAIPARLRSRYFKRN